MIRNNFCIDDLSPKCHLGRQEGGVTINDDTGVTLTESPDIQDNIWSHFGQLSLKKYRRKTSLNARSPRFSPSGTWASSTTSMGLGSTPTPSSWSSAMTRGLGVVSRSILAIILIQWSSKQGSFMAFQRARWRKPSFSARRCSTSPILMKPTANIPYAICLSRSMELRVTDVTFFFLTFWK